MSLSTVAKYLSSLVQKMRSAPWPFYPRTRANTNLFNPQKSTPGRTGCERSSGSCPRFHFCAQIINTTGRVPFRQIHRWVPVRFPEAGRALAQRPTSFRRAGGAPTAQGAAWLGQERSPKGHLPPWRWGISAAPQPPSQFVNVINLEVLLLPQVQLTLPSANP